MSAVAFEMSASSNVASGTDVAQFDNVSTS
jgi:hypothetical protein